MFHGIDDLKDHLNNCDGGFKTIPTRICRHFSNGWCGKGDWCKFSHPEELNNKFNISECRNGAKCGYLANGICSFYHWGVGVQKLNQNKDKNRTNCLYTEDCRRVPNCPFLHSEEDFPKLHKTQKPPIARASSVW